jgi:hypothetical protein
VFIAHLLATWAATAAHDADDQAIMTQKRFFACIPRRLGAAAFLGRSEKI